MSSKKISAYSNPNLLLLQKAQEHQSYIKALEIKRFNPSFLLDIPSIPHKSHVPWGMCAAAPLSNLLPSATQQNSAAFPFSLSTVQPSLAPCTADAATHTGGAPAPHSRDAAGAEQSQASRKFAACHHQSSVITRYLADSGKWRKFSSEFSTKVGPWILP